MKKITTFLLALLLSTFAAKAFAQDPLTQGKDLLDRKDCAGALRYLLQAFNHDPRSEKANLYLGNAYLCLGNIDSAAIFLGNAVKFDDESAPAYYGLGMVCIRQKKVADAIDNFKSAVNYDSKNGSYVIALGDAYLEADSLDAAMKSFYRARDMNDKNPQALEGIGDVYRKQNIFEPAIENYKEALQLDSMNIPLRLKLANTYMKNNDGGNAYEQFVKASELAPNNADAQYQAGDLLYINKRYHEAFPFLEKYHLLVPNDEKALLQLSESALEGHFYPEAVKYYQEYLTKNPGSILAKKSIAAAYFFESKPVDSYNAFKSIPLDSLDAKDLARYGLAARSIGDTSTAISAWTHAVTMDTTLWPIENQLASLLFADKRYADAIVHFKKFLALQPGDLTAELNMGLCYIASQDYPDAILTLKGVRDQKPDNYYATRWLAFAYSVADSINQAAEAYQNLIKLAQVDTSGASHSVELNEAYRYIAFSQIVAGAKIQKDKPDQAKKIYEDAYQNLLTALKYNAKDESTHAFLAQIYAYLGKIDDACKEIKIVLKANPKNDQMLKLQKALSCE